MEELDFSKPAREPVRAPAYDPAVGKVMLFGGKLYGVVHPNNEFVTNELWSWDGTTWTRAS